MSRILKRRMRDPPRAPIIERIVAFDEQRFIGLLRVLEVPPMVRIRLDGVRLALAVWVDQRCGDEVAVWHGVCVGNGERISEDGLDGTPDLQQ